MALRSTFGVGFSISKLCGLRSTSFVDRKNPLHMLLRSTYEVGFFYQQIKLCELRSTSYETKVYISFFSERKQVRKQVRRFFVEALLCD